MLSVLDLLDAGTLSIAQAAWLLDRILRGSSWLVGARPGGAGKTTIMAALLAMLPERESVLLAAEGTGWERASRGECVVAYEIGAGSYRAYVWGPALERFAALGERGVRLISNLHADTLEQAEQQIVRRNGVSPRHFSHFGLFLPISLGRGGRWVPTVTRISYHDGEAWRPLSTDEGQVGQLPRIARWLECMSDGTARTVEAVRAAWLEFLRQGAGGTQA